MHGFVVRFGERMMEALDGFAEEGTRLVLEGKIKNIEHRYNGLKEAGQALADVHSGANFGKAVIIVAEE